MLVLTDNQQQLIEMLKKWYDDWYAGMRRSNHPQWRAYSGAAGTGKTTVVKEVIKTLGLSEGEYMCCAYVGKAVLQLQRHGLSARTIHSLIYDIKMVYVPDPETGKKKLTLEMTLKPDLGRDLKLIFVDEATMVNDEMVAEILSFNIPVIFIGDMNQLPPVFGISSVMMHPDFILNQIMRQSEDDPIVQISQCILHNEPLEFGTYGLSHIVPLDEFDSRTLVHGYDQVLTMTNRERYDLNKFCRNDILGIPTNRPMLNDRVICRRNNWQLTQDGYALTNGLSGYITDISREYLYKNAYKIDFHPDFFPAGVDFEGVMMDAKHIMADYSPNKPKSWTDHELFEYAYAITVHLSQGSEYDNVVFFEGNSFPPEVKKRAMYTGVTRAKTSITLVRPFRNTQFKWL